MAYRTSSRLSVANTSAVSSTTVGSSPSLASSTAPVITGVFITNASYTNLPDTAMNTSGGYLKLIGSNFASGCTVYINGLAVTTTFVSSSEVHAVVGSGSAGTYSLMLFNNSSSGCLYAAGLTFSGYPSVTATSYSSSTAVVNVQLQATGSGTLNYTLQSGSTLPQGLSLSGTGLIFGTYTGANLVFVSTVTILVTDAYSQTTQQTITLSIVIGDLNFNYTPLLVNGETPITTYITDASVSNANITPTGTVSSNRFTPYLPTGYYSMLFNGSTDYLQLTVSNGLDLGTNACCVEAWVYLTSTASFGLFTTSSGASGQTRPNFVVSSTGFSIDYYANSFFSGSVTIPLNTWNHVAFTRQTTSGAWRFFLNGVMQGYNATGTQNLLQTGVAQLVGLYAGTYYAAGYLSNLRIMNGTIPSAYSTASTTTGTTVFTPSTAPLTAIAGTVFLTAQGPGFVDYASGIPIVLGGTPKIQTNQPFGPVASPATYNNYTNGYYSNYFAPSANGVALTQAASNTIFPSVNTGGFTFDFWIYPTPIAATWTCIVTSAWTSSVGVVWWELDVTNAGISFPMGPNGFGFSSGSISNSVPITPFVWTHIVVQRRSDGTTWDIYYNGQGVSLGLTNAYTFNLYTTNPIRLGIGYTSTNLSAYRLSNFRISNTQLFSANFTPSTTPYTTVSSTALLTCLNSTITDSGNSAFALTTTGNVAVVAASPFAVPTTTANVNTVGSGLFDGSTGYLSTPFNANLVLGSGSYTAEAWIYLTSGTGATYGQEVMGTYQGGSNIPGWGILVNYTSGAKGLGWVINNTFIASYTPYLLAGQWYHIAIVRNGTGTNNTTIYLNGISVAQVTDNTLDSNTSNPLNIGIQTNASGSYFPGYISNARFVKGTAIYTAPFALPTQPLTAVANTSLLTLQTRQSNNNNVFQDDSVFNLAVTRNGTPTQGTFTPFSQSGWSVYVSGSGTTTSYPFLTFPASTLVAPGNSKGTIECWIYLTGYSSGTSPTGAATIWSLNSGNPQYNALKVSSTGYLLIVRDGGGYISVTSTTLIPLNTWTHVAWTYTGTSSLWYVNGVDITSQFSSNPTLSGTWPCIGSQSLYIGATNYSYSSYTYIDPFIGYISNFRVVTGSTVYTTPFTPSSVPLTAITGTQVLTCLTSGFQDTSNNAFTVSSVGTPVVQPVSPFNPSTTYSTSIVGGSMYFNGSTDYLQLANSTAFDQNGSFTFECWVFPISTTGYFWAQYLSGYLCFAFSGGKFIVDKSYVGTQITSTGTYAASSWYHVVVSCDGATTRLFVNGTAQGSAATTGVASGAATTIGFYSTIYLNGYISNLRFIKGTALYTTNFTPPTAPPAPTANTSLLLLGTNAGVLDATSRTNIVTVGTSRTSAGNTYVKYGTGAVSFDGSTSALAIPYNPSLNLISGGNFTVECWFYSTAATSGSLTTIAAQWNQTTNYAGWILGFTNLTLTWNWAPYSTGVVLVSASTTFSTNTWVHVAVVKNGTTFTLYQNGVSVGSATNASTLSALTTVPISVGNYYNSGGTLGASGAVWYQGYIDDLRITNGVARYTANFTPPTGPLQTL